MTEEEFETVLDASDVLRQLVYGGEGMRKESNFEVFRSFGVTAEGLNVIRACIRLHGRLPTDHMSQDLAKSGRLRHFADSLGGFNLVYEALEKLEQWQLVTAQSDTTEEYEWRILPEARCGVTDFARQLDNLQKQDWQWISVQKPAAGEFFTCLHTMRRKRGRYSPSD